MCHINVHVIKMYMYINKCTRRAYRTYTPCPVERPRVQRLTIEISNCNFNEASSVLLSAKDHCSDLSVIPASRTNLHKTNKRIFCIFWPFQKSKVEKLRVRYVKNVNEIKFSHFAHFRMQPQAHSNRESVFKYAYIVPTEQLEKLQTDR